MTIERFSSLLICLLDYRNLMFKNYEIDMSQIELILGLNVLLV